MSPSAAIVRRAMKAAGCALSFNTIRWRMREYGWSLERAVATPRLPTRTAKPKPPRTSSYIDSWRAPRDGEDGFQSQHSWREFTEDRLCWLYGPNYRAERAAMTQADLAAWSRLGRRAAA